MFQFGHPFDEDVFKGRRRHDREAEKEDISLRIRKRTKSIIVFLACCIPKTKIHSLSIQSQGSRVVVKYSWNILSRK